ncbi:MAG: M48 family metalloprotease [Legionellaceae bacterium]|nr:M48 family metalloprotease [Legionellaceae bacterium]
MDFKKYQIFNLVIGLFLLSQSVYAITSYTNDTLDTLKKSYQEAILRSPSVIHDPLVNEYVQRIADNLTHTVHGIPVHFFVINTSEINAFAGPGEYIGIHTGLIAITRSESELAAVMAHEIAHEYQHHLYHMLEHEKQQKAPMLAAMLASIALGMVNPALANGALMASMGGFAQNSINFTRAHEQEADRIGLTILERTNYNPYAMVQFLKRMQEQSRYYFSNNTPSLLRTHPLDEERIAEAENRAHKRAESDPEPFIAFKIYLADLINKKPQNELYQFSNSCHGTENICQYAWALALLRTQQYVEAANHLRPLLILHPSNLFYQLTMASIEQHTNPAAALNRLAYCYQEYPDHAAIIWYYAEALIAASRAQTALSLLLPATRKFPKNIELCELLAQAQAQSNQKGFAYFTKAQCALLRESPREAMIFLQQAKSLAKKNAYLRARIDARIAELKESRE